MRLSLRYAATGRTCPRCGVAPPCQGQGCGTFRGAAEWGRARSAGGGKNRARRAQCRAGGTARTCSQRETSASAGSYGGYRRSPGWSWRMPPAGSAGPWCCARRTPSRWRTGTATGGCSRSARPRSCWRVSRSCWSGPPGRGAGHAAGRGRAHRLGVHRRPAQPGQGRPGEPDLRRGPPRRRAGGEDLGRRPARRRRASWSTSGGIDDLPAIVAEFVPGRCAGSASWSTTWWAGRRRAGSPPPCNTRTCSSSAIPTSTSGRRSSRRCWASAAGRGCPPARPGRKACCAALGWPPDTAAAWQRILRAVTSFADLEPEFLGRVEELIDFVTAQGSH